MSNTTINSTVKIQMMHNFYDLYIDDNLKLLMERNGVETYFAGNGVCSTDSSLDCEPLCSKHCWSRRVSNDGYCDVDCGTEECQFDGGDCNDLKKTAL